MAALVPVGRSSVGRVDYTCSLSRICLGWDPKRYEHWSGLPACARQIGLQSTLCVRVKSVGDDLKPTPPGPSMSGDKYSVVGAQPPAADELDELLSSRVPLLRPTHTPAAPPTSIGRALHSLFRRTAGTHRESRPKGGPPAPWPADSPAHPRPAHPRTRR